MNENTNKQTFEKQLAASVVLHPPAMRKISDFIFDHMFDNELWRAMFVAVQSFVSRGTTPDVLQIAYEVSHLIGQEMKMADMLKLTKHVRHENVLEYANGLQNEYLRDQAYTVISDALMKIDTVPSAIDAITATNEAMRQVLQKTGGDINHNRIGRLTSAALDETLAAMNGAPSAARINYDMPTLDRVTGGMKVGDQIVIAGRAGMGKTTFTANVALNAARQNKIVLFMSLEMSAVSITQLFQSILTGIPLDRLRMGKISESNIIEIERANDELNELPLYIVDGIYELNRIIAFAEIHKLRIGLDMLIVDYIQLVRVPNESNRVEQIGIASRRFKELAGSKNANCVNLLLSQFNRDATKFGASVKPPKLSDLKGSGALEEDATCVIGLHRESYYDPRAVNKMTDVIVMKNRYGQTGYAQMVYDGRRYMDADTIDAIHAIESNENPPF